MNLDNNPNQKPERKLNIKADILIGLSIIIILLLLLFKGCQAPDSDPALPTANVTTDVIQGDIPGLTDTELDTLMQSQTDDSMFTVQAVSAGTIQAGSTQLQLTVANPQNNIHDCRFDLLINGENLYTSPILQPQTYIQSMELNRTLDPGEYTAVVRYSILSDSGDVTGVTEVEVMVICK